MCARTARPSSKTTVALALLAVLCVWTAPAHAQNFERYRPFSIPPAPSTTPNLRGVPDSATGSDEILIDRLDAVIVHNNADAVDPLAANADTIGLINRDTSGSTVVASQAFTNVVYGYIGRPVSLRSLNQLTRDIVLLYRRVRRPVVDVIIPEQKITGGTVQLVIVESRIDRVIVEGGEFFDPCYLTEWIDCTRRGGVIYEPSIEHDLFWLNQSPFRRVDVDLRPGSVDGTSDVVFRVNDVRPIRAYVGYDDTGVRTLGRERLMAGLVYGNLFGRDGTLSYQYTTDGDLNRLHAHALSYVQPIGKEYTYAAYASWAGVVPVLGGGFNQDGESWQAGTELKRHLEKTQWYDESIAVGLDFKSTNNNLEFGGINVQNGFADLIQLRANYERITRDECLQYSILRAGVFVGPGGGFTNNSNAANFQTIRPDTSPDYVYARLNYEEALNLGRCDQWHMVLRAAGQVSSERLLFSETLGFGGYDTIRGYDQRTLNADHGWQLSCEFGPRPTQFCYRGDTGRFRAFAFVDMGDSYIQNPLPGEDAQEFLASVGLGMRASLGPDVAFRMDYGFGLEEVAGFPHDRLHIGLIWLFGPQP